jgi:hypothetical protein
MYRPSGEIAGPPKTRAPWPLCPETEFNFTHYYEGSHNGHSLLYVTPGVVLGRFTIHNRFGFVIGGGLQIAATSFHPTNHNVILSIRFPF